VLVHKHSTALVLRTVVSVTYITALAICETTKIMSGLQQHCSILVDLVPMSSDDLSLQYSYMGNHKH